MSKVRVYQLAKELNISSKDLINKLAEFDLEVTNHMSTLEDSEAELITKYYKEETQQDSTDEAEKNDSKEEKAVKDPSATKDVKVEKAEAKVTETKVAAKAPVKADADQKQKGKKSGKKAKKNKGKIKRNFRDDAMNEKNEINENTENNIVIGERITVGEFAEMLEKPANELILKLMNMGTMATINQEIDFETAELLAVDYGVEIEKKVEVDEASLLFDNIEDKPEDLVRRAPVVTVMGHVDHGKTSLLDAIRDTDVTIGEAGGITQHIGASEVHIKGEKIVFLDTPGHEAFTTLRARGAKVTDIAILVVAADDGVMPQTIEAIDHAKAAGVPIIVAINKIDKPNANPDRVKQELSDRGILIEEWGGDIISVPVSALKREGIDTLLEMVLLVAEMQELKANPDRPGLGTIIEAKVDKGRGPVATVLVETGTLSVGDSIIAGTTFGRVRAMYNYLGKKVKTVGPASSVEITGLAEVPQAGDKFYVTKDDRTARVLAERKTAEIRETSLKQDQHVSLEDLFSRIQEGEIQDLNIIVKADVHGSVEALRQSLLKITNEEVRVNVIHGNVGTITESDVLLASASNAIIIGFNVRPSLSVTRMAEAENVEVNTYRIIYEAIKDVESAMKGMLAPEYKEVVQGTIEVRTTFKVPKIGVIAGAYVLNGKVTRNSSVRLVRDGIVIHEGKISSLKRFKDDAKEVLTGFECGIGIEDYNDLKEGDIIEAFIIEEIKRV